MSLWRELLTSIVVETANRITRSQTGEFGTVERLAGQLGWSVHERRGDAAVLHFSDPAAGIRKLYVRPADGGGASFMTASLATFGAVPQAVAEYLLARNAQIVVGAWSASTLDHGTVLVLVHKSALRSLQAAAFGEICEAMVWEAQCLDAQLQSAGVLSRSEACRG